MSNQILKPKFQDLHSIEHSTWAKYFSVFKRKSNQILKPNFSPKELLLMLQNLSKFVERKSHMLLCKSQQNFKLKKS
jgi:hypothetical protein